MHQRFVQGYQRIAEPPDPGLVAERLAQRLTERDGGVLDRVVRVDVQIAAGTHGQVEPAVLAKLADHVVEERDPGERRRHARAIEVQIDDDVRLQGLAFDPGGAAHACPAFPGAGCRVAAG